MTILIKSSNDLFELIQTRTLSIIKKSQKAQSAYNYYFNPSIQFEVYNSKVIICNSNYMVFEFDKYKHSSLYKMLQSINQQLYNYLKNSYTFNAETIYNIFSETDNTFTLRCYLPHVGRKYLIQCMFYNQDVPFKLPNPNYIFESITIDIKNIWESNNRIGFNLELKVCKN